MLLTLPDAWAWDFWTADDGERHHLFSLNAPRDLADPELRHRAAGVGHAVVSAQFPGLIPREGSGADAGRMPSSTSAR
jgi:hypothetical protein